tara:strand:+ start:4793 stop:5125 length:333 start_codon:yes stop_codon:yes gene_type:complete
MSKTDKDRIEAAIEYAKDSGVITGEDMVEAWPGASDAMAECPRCTSHVVGRKTDDYYYWMFQCCLLVIIAGFGAWLHTQWHSSPMQGLVVDVGFPIAWTWLAIFLFDILR